MNICKIFMSNFYSDISRNSSYCAHLNEANFTSFYKHVHVKTVTV